MKTARPGRYPGLVLCYAQPNDRDDLKPVNRSVPFPVFVKSITARAQSLAQAWYLDAVLVPFITTRLVWIMIAWFSRYFMGDPAYAKYIERGWYLSPHYWLDIWSRWDGKWYLSIISNGYVTNRDITYYLSNLPFFPLYPYLVKTIGLIFPDPAHNQGAYLLYGLVLSNLFFLIAAGLLYKLVVDWIGDDTLARRTLLLLFAFPTSFIFSCFYPESLFLLLSVAAYSFALKRRWLLASLAGGLLAITRPQGVLIAVPLVWLYLSSRQWKLREIRLDSAWLGLIPVSIGLHLFALYQKTGFLFAPIVAQKAWERDGNLLSDTLTILQSPEMKTRQIDLLIWIVFLAVTLIAMWRLPSRSYGVYALLQIFLPVSSGSVFSFGRFALVIFPTFIMLARLLSRRSLAWMVTAIFFALQVIYFLGWVNYYWID